MNVFGRIRPFAYCIGRITFLCYFCSRFAYQLQTAGFIAVFLLFSVLALCLSTYKSQSLQIFCCHPGFRTPLVNHKLRNQQQICSFWFLHSVSQRTNCKTFCSFFCSYSDFRTLFVNHKTTKTYAAFAAVTAALFLWARFQQVPNIFVGRCLSASRLQDA